MRRTEKLVELSRRDFCALAGAGLVVAGCTDGSAPIVETGPLGAHPDAPPEQNTPDAPPQPNQPDARPGSPDASVTNPDASTGGGGPACTGTATDCGGPPSSFGTTPKLIGSKFFVVKDSGGLYAVSARCTHEGATCQVYQSEFLCPRHGAEFTWNGDIISGPVFTGLVHYAMCILPNGNVGVTTQTVSQSTRMAG
jgi:nitrite reductase/ring-hydroxylating ferredoxin subunit